MPNLLKNRKISSVLLITDQQLQLRISGITASLEKELADAHILCAIYGCTCANPTVHNVEETRGQALEAARLIFKNLERAYIRREDESVRAMNQRMNIPATLKGIRKEDIPSMACRAGKEAHPLYPVPVLMDNKELEQFYYKIADWSDGS